MNTFKMYYTLLTHVFTEPACDVTITSDLPFPYWLLGLWLVYGLIVGSVRTYRGFLWTVAQLLLISRIESLSIAMLLPFIVDKPASCSMTDYLCGMTITAARTMYLVYEIVVQFQNVSLECKHALEKAVIAVL